MTPLRSRPLGRPGCGPEPCISRKLAIPAGCPGPEGSFLEERVVSLLGWQGLFPTQLELAGIQLRLPTHHPPPPTLPARKLRLEVPGRLRN